MTDTNTQPATSKTPAYIAYQVREGKNGKDFWTRIGSAWEHANGQGFTVQVQSVPLHGRIILRLPYKKPE